MILADDKDPHGSEEFEDEFLRLKSIAEGYTGFERLKLSGPYESMIMRLQKFIQEETEMRDLTPHKLEDINKKVRHSADKDDFYERL